MKTKHKDKQESQHANYHEKVNEEKRNKDRSERIKQDQSSSREESNGENESVKQTLSRGYNPDGPGGNYRGV